MKICYYLLTTSLLLVPSALARTCPTIEQLGVIELPFHPTSLAAGEIAAEDSLLVTSFFNVAISQMPGPPFVILERDLVARITNLDEIEEEDFMFSVPRVEELSDLLPGQPLTVWPNEAIAVPHGVFPFEAILIPQGFLTGAFPGRHTAIDLYDPARTEYIISESTQQPGGFNPIDPLDPENAPRAYNNAVFYDMDGDGFKDIITVRSGLRVGAQLYPPYSELLWFRNPGEQALDPNVEWDETILYGGPLVGFQGPDTFVQMHDFDGDGVPEFVATHFFTGFKPATADTGKITLYGAPTGSDWSQVNALDPDNSLQARTRHLVTKYVGSCYRESIRRTELSTWPNLVFFLSLVIKSQGKPFGIEIVDLNADARVDILCTNHQPDGSTAFPSEIPGRVFALEQPTSGDIFVDDWTTHVLLDDIRPNFSLANARASRLAPGAASAICPFSGKGKKLQKPWIVVGGDEASKVWLLSPVTKQDWTYNAQVILDINEYYGPEISQTPLLDPLGITSSTIGKVIAIDSKKKRGDLVILVPVFEANHIHVLRLTSECSNKGNRSKPKKGNRSKPKKGNRSKSKMGNRSKSKKGNRSNYMKGSGQ
jgi:hypothetical protein